MRNIITCLTVSLLSGATFATTWTVDDDGKADFNNIQAAVDAASDGDKIIVMPGTYTSTQDGHVVNMLGKAVTLRSSDPSDPDVVAATIIDGEDTRRGLACFNEETSETIISGFTITNGFSVDFDYDGNGNIGDREVNGGGMYNYYSNPTLTDCTFTGNAATTYGGGMYSNSSNPTLTGCTFTDNSGNGGGGMFNESSSPELLDCTFSNNIAVAGGGGVYNNGGNSNPTLTNCTFIWNVAGTGGGGLSNSGSSGPTINNCMIVNNSAGEGGGMRSWSSNPTLTDTTVCGNDPDQTVGGWTDNGGNMIADECPIDCPDINGDGYVNVSDLLTIIDQWGLANSPADVNEDGIVDVLDLLIVVGNWGPCE